MRSPGLPSLGFSRGRAAGGGHLHGGHAAPEAMLRPAESGEGPDTTDIAGWVAWWPGGWPMVAGYGQMVVAWWVAGWLIDVDSESLGKYCG